MEVELNREVITNITFDSAKKIYNELKRKYTKLSSKAEGVSTTFLFEEPKSPSNPKEQTLKFNF